MTCEAVADTKSASPGRGLPSVFLILTCAASATAIGQVTDSYPSYPQPATYPPGNAYAQQAMPGSANPSMRNLFAASLAQVAQVNGTAAIMSMADGLTGALRDWFDRRRQRNNGAAAGNGATASYGATPSYSAYPGNSMTSAAMPAPAGYPQTSAPANFPAPDPNYPGSGGSQSSSGYPQPPGDPQASGYPQTSAGPQASGYPQTPAYSQSSGYPQSAGSYTGSGVDPNSPTGASAPAGAGQLYAGIAYEIHLQAADGSSRQVDPASYAFRGGDRFSVYYRPALPGKVDVFNIDAAGQNTQIDTVNVAAGQLASLGPYEFADQPGNETLILRLTTCVTPSLLATTRSIIKVQNAAPASSLQLDSCSSVVTRGLKKKPQTRSIRKVSVEGGTSFALDPVSREEMSTGQYAPRQITITLQHH